MPQATPDPPEAAPKRFRLRWIPTLFLVVGLAGVIFIRSRETLDADYKNLGTVICGGGALVLVWGWFVLLSGFAPRTRRLVALLSIGAVVLAAVLLRFEGPTGDMWPRFVFRWTPKADRLLAAPVPSDDTQPLRWTADLPYHYPQFLGPDRRATISGLRLARDWKANPPRLVWRQPIGAGWSAFSVAGDYAITQEQRGDEQYVVCYALKTGDVLWAHADPGRFYEAMGGVGPRATPTIHDGKVYTQGAEGLLNCLDAATGEPLWSRNIIEENGAKNIVWGRSGSPLIVDNLVIVSAGGPNEKSLVAYHKDTGEPVWSAGEDQASHASPVLATLAGVRQVLSVNEDWVVAHAADDGRILWRHTRPGKSDFDPNCSQPVVLEGDRVFFSKGYGGGCVLLQISQDQNGDFAVKELWKNEKVLRTKMTNVVVRDGFIYGLSGGILECVDVETGKRQWKRGRYGHGQVILVDDLLLITSERGELVLVEATPEEHRQLARIQAIEGKTWNNHALAGPYVLVRNHEEAACYELPLVP